MKKAIARSILALASSWIFLCVITRLSSAQQIADSSFNTKVDHPAYVHDHPKVLIDEAHSNFHTANGRYKPFADLLISDGYQVAPNKEKFLGDTLKSYHILVVANALGAESRDSAEWSNGWFEAGAKPAFSDEECDAVRDWVWAGGSLLLVADHLPFGPAAEILAKRFSVDMGRGYTWDEVNALKEFDNPGIIVYTRENGTLADHAITRGRDTSERINRIVAFVGQSLTGHKGSEAFLKLASTAIERESLLYTAKVVSAAGRSQGIALQHGKGRVIVLGEAAMLTAQQGGKMKFGMNYPGVDNKQLTLNIVHWLSGLLD